MVISLRSWQLRVSSAVLLNLTSFGAQLRTGVRTFVDGVSKERCGESLTRDSMSFRSNSVDERVGRPTQQPFSCRSQRMAGTSQARPPVLLLMCLLLSNVGWGVEGSEGDGGENIRRR